MSAWWVAAALAQSGEVAIRGSVRHAGAGPVVVEVLQVPEEGPVLLVVELRLERPNSDFELSVPANLGPVRIRAAADAAGDGVGEDDPQILYPEVLVVERRAIEGIELNLVQTEPK